jgi:hypothetical protein
MEKRLEVRLNEDFYNEVVKYCHQYSLSISVGTRLLLKQGMSEVARKNGFSQEITIPADLKMDLEDTKYQGVDLNAYIISVLKNNVDYRRKYVKKPSEYFDTHNEQKESYSQEYVEKREVVLNTPRVPFEKENMFMRDKYTQHPTNEAPKNSNQKVAWNNEKNLSDAQIKIRWEQFQKENQ